MQVFFVNPKCNNDCISGFLSDSGYQFEQVREGVWFHYVGKSRVEIATTLAYKQAPMKIETVLDKDGGKIAEHVAHDICHILGDLCNPEHIVGSCCMILDKKTFFPVFDQNGDPIFISFQN